MRLNYCVHGQYTLGEKHEVMGQALTVTLPSTVSKGSKTSLKVYYDTTESGLAVQWLEKEYVKND